jgi:hypothetical protein
MKRGTRKEEEDESEGREMEYKTRREESRRI